MGFEKRIVTASKFECSLFEAIERSDFMVAFYGTEHSCPEFVDKLSRSNDQTSLAIRFQPDIVAHIGKRVPRSFFVEAKAAQTIERTAYEQYMKLYNSGNIVVVVFEPLKWRWSFVEEMMLIDGNKSIALYPPEKRFPVEDGWLYPRRTRHGTIGAGGSGTPYRYINRRGLRTWASFKPDIIQRLGENNIEWSMDQLDAQGDF